MRPLQPMALGFAVIALVAPIQGYDVFADPLGWVLVLAGIGHAPLPPHRVRRLRPWAMLSFGLSVVLWFPAVREQLEGAHDSLAWFASLPQLVFCVLLCTMLAEVAAAVDGGAARWLRICAGLLVTVAAIPVLVGAGLTALADVAVIAAAAGILLLIVLLLAYSGRPWAMVPRPAP